MSDLLVDEYADWIHENSALRKVNAWREITVPFLDHSGGHFQFYARVKDSDLLFDDDGYTLNSMETMGSSLRGKREERLGDIARQFGAMYHDGSIVMVASPERSGDAMNRYIQALIHVDSLMEVITKRTASYFVEDVAETLTEQGIFYMKDINIQGKSLYLHNFSFLFQKSRELPTTFAQAPNRLDETAVATIMFAWNDVHDTKERKNAVLCVFADDRSGKANQKALTGFARYGVKVLGFTEIPSKARRILPA
ncbi:DUF1828 domain-containing protein [Bifidobacterium sp. ESL0745]|uniref:DUF1829 domain-containing protein n=1 Tax=Bifidobacterium sp. ESL0745 TaxID=2983226 RepID=UPI0023F81BE5|nr:DUF1828 domain-containing protein [Bifidobacterium sp. ESL0745]MDF7665390.1 DUF1829 domain-containing protein [Bifidobacterium sp. ESL0745]